MKKSPFYPIINADKFSKVVNLLRQFFLDRGYKEVHTQNILSILAACEDPFNISSFNYDGEVWPLPQTGQMNLEHYLLKEPHQKGFFCVSTSYRNEPDAIEGRHCKIFPMFEFEMKGNMTNLALMETELLTYLGFKTYEYKNYEEACKDYNVSIIGSDVEAEMSKDISTAVLLMNFPERTNPFWNMKRGGHNMKTARKIDVILHGQETIGSAERSCDKQQMRDTFFTIEEGKYAEKLFELFGKERVLEELDEFFNYDFIERSGGGIGITRLIRAMELEGLL
jgi:aspartyl/asparaginyl-tRNA synthetase